MTALDELRRRGALSMLDRHFALALSRMAGDDRPEVLLGAALASRAVQHGHVCADLGRLSETPLLDDHEQPITDVELPDLEHWAAALASSNLVRRDDHDAPLVLTGHRLYLQRYADYEARLARSIRARLDVVPFVDTRALSESLDRLFADAPAGDLQWRAAEMATAGTFSVISGGPGTGKTTTVAKILAVLGEQAHARGRAPLRMLLVAPTGKAAQRLGESIGKNLRGLELDPAVHESIPTTAATIHRALGFRIRTPTRFRHDASNPLSADVVVADEASMIDLALMAKLFDAVPLQARLILLGDKDQLASVEAGAILGDIYTAELLSRRCVHLSRSYRYDPTSGIGRLARAINTGDASGAVEALGAGGDATLRDGSDEGLDAHFADQAVRRLADLANPDPRVGLQALEGYRVLCALRRGRLGSEQLNRRVETALTRAGVVRPDGDYYPGRPLLITRNDHQLGLYNGDVGIVGERGGTRRAFFPSGDGEMRSFLPARLPPHETVYAMTVHKSQGSEFDEVALVLPAAPSPILTRELVYTGVTRARQSVTIFGTEELLRAAVGRRIERASGLTEALSVV